MAVTIFVLGILGIVFCALLAPFAWIKVVLTILAMVAISSMH